MGIHHTRLDKYFRDKVSDTGRATSPQIFHDMKKTLTIITSVICVGALFVAGAENADGSFNFFWTFGCLCVSLLAGWATYELSKEDKKNV